MNLKKHKTVYERTEAVLIEKKSRFIATAAPIKNEAEALYIIEELRKTHYNASHNVYGYILGENSEVQRFSDDGEPNGTAGMPVLNVIKSEGLINTIVVVTRYFGGTLLGAGGLVRAYSKSAKQGVVAAKVIEKTPHRLACVTVNYSLSGKLQYELLNQSFTIFDTIYESDVTYNIAVESGKEDFFVTLINDSTNALAEIKWQNTVYCSVIDNKLQILD